MQLYGGIALRRISIRRENSGHHQSNLTADEMAGGLRYIMHNVQILKLRKEFIQLKQKVHKIIKNTMLEFHHSRRGRNFDHSSRWAIAKG